MSECYERYDEDLSAIAIIGMAGRFPSASDVDALWQLIANGGSGIRPVKAEMLSAAGLDPRLALAPNYVPRAAWVDGEDCFDAEFFTIAPREAAEMDPQQRLLMECAYHALESAGYAPRQLEVSVGVYLGTKLPTYYVNNLLPHLHPLHSLEDLKVQVGADKSYAATRVAHALNLQGPVLSVDTACSTSLVSVHLACRALLNEECDLALAGGANINVPQRVGYWFQEGGIQSPDGRCRAFDAQAAGTVFGNGLGLVVLKRLDEARRDGDNVIAIIRGTAVNNDGADKMGFWAPGVSGQSAVIRLAQAMAGVSGAEIDYVEAHGTGTALGDPIEIAALSDAFESTDDSLARQHCAIASVKSNLGHLEVAAGITGLIKLALALERAQMPPSADFRQANPKIDFAQSPFYVNTELRPWPLNAQGRRLAAVSSFGIGGTNAHAIVEGRPQVQLSTNTQWRLWPFSAANLNAVQQLGQTLVAGALARQLHPGDVAYTLQQGRERFRWRNFCLVAPNQVQAEGQAVISRAQIQSPAEPMASLKQPRALRIAFLFPGQGSQFPGMLSGLWATCPVFRRELSQCFSYLRQWLAEDPEVIWRRSGGGDQHSLYQTRYAQPMLFALEYALARQWQAWGVEPDLMLGHSLGEYVAACLGGVFRLEDALHLLVQRGELCEASAPGAMFSVALEASAAEQLVGDLADVAALNATRLTVLGIPAEERAALIERLDQAQVPWRQLKAQRAFHSRLLKPHVDQLRQVLLRIPLQPPQRAVISNITGAPLSAAEACDPEYWVRHLLEPVQFAAGIEQLKQQQVDVVLEVGPGQVLSQLARVNGLGARQGHAPVISSGRRADQSSDADGDMPSLLNALGRLWQAGVEPVWAVVNQHPDSGAHRDPATVSTTSVAGDAWQPQRVRLAGYPFQPQRHWREPPTRDGSHFGQALGEQVVRQPSLQSERWHRLSLQPVNEPDLSAQVWLVFHDTLGYSADLAYRLRDGGARVIDIYDNRIHAMSGVDAHSLDPCQPADFSILLDRLRAADLHPHGLVFSWGLSETTADSDTPFQALTALGRALRPRGDFDALTADEGSTAPQLPRLLLLHNHTAEVLGHEQLCPCKSMLPAAAAVLAQEFGLECCSVDIDIADEDERQLGGRRRRTVEQSFNLLISNEDHWHSGAPLAIRGHYCWRREFEDLPRPQRYEAWRGQGLYLITGGVSGIGRCFAAYLLRQAPAARLILVGRRAQQHEAVQACLADLKQVSLAAAPSATAKIEYHCCDVGDSAAFSALLQQLQERYGDFNGVMHSAGLAASQRLENKSAAQMAQILAPKCDGSRVLLRALRGRNEVDWVLLNSSLLALGGLVGQYDYAAANRYMDTLAAVGRHHRVPMCAVNWDAWQGLGMLADTATDTRLPSLPIAHSGHALLGQERPTQDPQRRVFQQYLFAQHDLLRSHRIFAHGVLPNTAWVDFSCAVGAQLWGQGEPILLPLRIDGLEISTPLVLDEAPVNPSPSEPLDTADTSVSAWLELHTDVLLTDAHSATVAVYSLYPGQQESQRQLHCRFRVTQLSVAEQAVISDASRECPAIHLDPAQLPELTGFDPLAFIDYGKLGTAWRSLEHCHSDGQVVWSQHQVPVPSSLESEQCFYPPATLDAALGLANGAALLHHRATLGQAREGLFLPQRYASIVCLRPLPNRFTSHCRLHSSGPQHLSMDLDLRDETGELLMRVSELELTATSREAFSGYLERAVQRMQQAQMTRQRGRDDELATAEGRTAFTQVSAQAGVTPLLPGMISPAMAPSLFDQLLSLASSQGYAQVAVCAGDVYQRLQAWRQRLAEHLGEVEAKAGLALRPGEAGENTQVGRSDNKGIHAREELPAGVIEERIAQLWRELIGVEQVSRSANFFELGGHSLMATQMAARLRDEYAVEVPLEALFEEPTVAAMSALVQARLWAIRGTGATAQGGLSAAREEGVL